MKQSPSVAGLQVRVLLPWCKNRTPEWRWRCYLSTKMLTRMLVHQVCTARQDLCQPDRCHAVLGTSTWPPWWKELIRRAAQSHSAYRKGRPPKLSNKLSLRSVECLQGTLYLSCTTDKTTWIFPFPNVLCPTRTARPLSCNAPARISLALALSSLTCINKVGTTQLKVWHVLGMKTRIVSSYNDKKSLQRKLCFQELKREDHIMNIFKVGISYIWFVLLSCELTVYREETWWLLWN